MRLATFQHGGSMPQAGIVENDRITGTGLDMISVINAGTFPAASGPSYPISEVKLLAPVPRPPKFICIGLNYRDHARETGLELPTIPTVFSKFSNVVIGPGDPIVLPRASKRPDY